VGDSPSAVASERSGCAPGSGWLRSRQQAGRSEVRVLFVFDPWRAAILLVAVDKTGNWDRWYREAIPRAERLDETYLAERQKEMGRRRSPSCATKRRAGGSPRCVNVEA